MNKRNFYVVLICVIVAAFGFSTAAQFRARTITEQACPNGNCETIVKEYEYLSIENDYSEDQKPTSTDGATTVEKSTGLAGDLVETDEDAIYNRSVFMAGNKVTAKQLDVNGMIFAAGREVKTTTKQQSIAAAGQDVIMDSVTHQEAYLAGVNVELTRNSSVRDLFVAGETVTVRGVVRGDVFAAGANIIFQDATILGDVNLGAENIEFKGDNLIHGTLRYDSAAKVVNLEKSKVGGIASYVVPNTSSDIWFIILSAAAGVCSMISCISIFIVFLGRISGKQYDRFITSKSAVKDLGIGLVSLLVVPCILIMMIGFDFLGLITAVLFLSAAIAAFCSVGIGAALLGRFVSSTILKSKDGSIYQIAMLGAITFSLIAIIPVFGGTVNFLLAITGFGYIIGELIHVVVSKKNIKVAAKKK